jgi:hypothetical protein
MPHARTTDPSTSHEAAASVKNLSRTQSGILGILKTPMTDEQLIVRYQRMFLSLPELFPRASDSGIRSRRAELFKLGLVEPIGYSKTKSNRKTIIWSKA